MFSELTTTFFFLCCLCARNRKKWTDTMEPVKFRRENVTDWFDAIVVVTRKETPFPVFPIWKLYTSYHMKQCTFYFQNIAYRNIGWCVCSGCDADGCCNIVQWYVVHFRYTLEDTCMQDVCAWHAHYSNTTIIANNYPEGKRDEREKGKARRVLARSLSLIFLSFLVIEVVALSSVFTQTSRPREDLLFFSYRRMDGYKRVGESNGVLYKLFGILGVEYTNIFSICLYMYILMFIVNFPCQIWSTIVRLQV